MDRHQPSAGTSHRTRLGTRDSAVGALLGFGAPVGYVVARCFFSGRAPLAVVAWRAERSGDGLRLPRPGDAGRLRPLRTLPRRHEERALDAAPSSSACARSSRRSWRTILRNPIQSILLEVELLLMRHPKEPAAGPRWLRSSEYIGPPSGSTTCGRPADASRIEALRDRYRRAARRRRSGVSALVDRLTLVLGEHHVQTTVEPGLPMVVADPLRFDQILTNLIENAAKYSPAASPIAVACVRARRRRGVGDRPRAWHRARGDARLFDRFYQARRARAQKTVSALGST